MFAKMQKCCIKGCDSHKHDNAESIGSFQFPLHDEILLKKWLRQIDVPNWKPSPYHRICSMHFQSADILSHPNEKQPYLKLTSIPTIFPTHPVEVVNLNGTTPPLKHDDAQTQPTRFIGVVGNGCAIQSGPVILIRAQLPTQMVVQNINQTSVNSSPQSIEQITLENSQMPLYNSAQYIKQINVQSYPTYRYLSQSNVQNLPQISQSGRSIFTQSPAQHSDHGPKQDERSRLRKILPRLNQSNVQNLPQISQSGMSSFTESPAQHSDQGPKKDQRSRLRKILPKPQNAVPKPDVLIIPRVEDPDPNSKRCFYRYPGNKVPILRVSIEREYDSKTTDCSAIKGDRMRLRSNAKTESTEKANSTPREVTIENSSTNKAVTFTLDPKTREIVVTTRPLNVSTRDDPSPESTRVERKVDIIPTPETKLRQLYIKGQQECIALERRLRVLRRRHQEEQEEIQKLEEHLSVLSDKVPRSHCEDPAESRCAKRKATHENGQSDDQLPSSPETKTMKQDFQTERDVRLSQDPSTRRNDQSKEQEDQTDGNRNKMTSGFPRGECNSRDIENSSEGDTTVKTASNCSRRSKSEHMSIRRDS